ncbi:MAG: phospho-N-acetylmuramoyl-pentapeptide-transferase [Planctomycetota bacterium]
MLFNLLEITRQFLIETGLYRFAQILDQQVFRVFAAGLLAFAIMLVSGRPFIARLVRMKIGDAARFDVRALEAAMKSKANTPTMGGLLIAAAIFISTFLLADLTNPYVQYGLVVLVWHALLGGVDDWLKLTAQRRGGGRQGLHAWEKLVFQLGIGLLIGYFAWEVPLRVPDAPDFPLAHAVNWPFVKTYDHPAAEPAGHLIFMGAITYTLVMTLMMAGMSNAVNITDGMDGLASGVATCVAIGIVVLCFIAGSESIARDLLVPYVWKADELAVLAAAMGGACLGFLWFNCAPAAVFMGDTGSLCLGGLVGYLAVVLRQEFVVLVMSGIFLIEIVSVVLQVGYFKATKDANGQGKRIFRCAPYHWHLHMGGLGEQKIVARFWIISIVLTAIALGSLKLR